ncbi:MAG TPA: ATP-binding cassette domain-containing protein [Anaerolineaceae bacterium]|nr:ATP-binding cassette domain-containing protein [Anaerolineaceae bacterium]
MARPNEQNQMVMEKPDAYQNGNKAFIELRKVVKIYKSAAGDYLALNDINIEVDAGEFVAVIGKSGSGKSTLINMITGIDRPTSGEVLVGDTAVNKLSEDAMAKWRGRNLGIVFQFFQLLPTLSVVENIMLPMDFCNLYSLKEREERAMSLLKMVDLEDQANKLPAALSGGQQQRVAIARALANDPPMVIADEPTGNLDSKMADAVFSLFENLVSQGKTVVMVTHDSSLAKQASRTILLADGEVVNEYVARALPTLTPQQMIKVTHSLEPMTFQPGSSILQEGSTSDKFYIISQGQVEVALKRPNAPDIVVALFSPGQYFGEIELMRGGKTVATIKAAPETPVQLLALEREPFFELLSESEETKKTIDQTAQLRLQENVSSRESS